MLINGFWSDIVSTSGLARHRQHQIKDVQQFHKRRYPAVSCNYLKVLRAENGFSGDKKSLEPAAG
jgi:hypothetical protein